MSVLPNLFILGAPKCGTTSLYKYLKVHPDIYMSEIKEPHYYNTSSSYRFEFSKESYLSLFKNGAESKYRGEASVWYFYFEEAVKNILIDQPDAKFIFLTRDNVDLFLSLHKELVYIGEEEELDPEKAWDLQEDRKAGNAIPKSNIEPRLLFYKDICKLDKHIALLKATIPSQNLHISSLDTMKENFDVFMQEIYTFLEIDEIELDSTIHNATKNRGRKSILVQRAIRLIYKVKRKLHFPFSLGILNYINKNNHSTKEITKPPTSLFIKRLKAELL